MGKLILILAVGWVSQYAPMEIQHEKVAR